MWEPLALFLQHDPEPPAHPQLGGVLQVVRRSEVPSSLLLLLLLIGLSPSSLLSFLLLLFSLTPHPTPVHGTWVRRPIAIARHPEERKEMEGGRKGETGEGREGEG